MSYYDPATAEGLHLIYRVWRSDQNRNEVVEYCLPAINGYMARFCWENFPDSEMADLSQSLVPVLIDAVERFDPERGATLWTWINCQLRFGCLNYLKAYRKQCRPDVTIQCDLVACDSRMRWG